MALPEYTDGVFELYRIENDESEDFPEEKLRDTGMRFWYRELAVYDTTRAKLSADKSAGVMLSDKRMSGGHAAAASSARSATWRDSCAV